MAGRTTNLRKELFAFLEVICCGVTCGRNSQTAMPDHEVLILVLSHLRIELLAGQVGVDILLQIASVPFGMRLRRIHAVDILCKPCLYLGVFR